MKNIKKMSLTDLGVEKSEEIYNTIITFAKIENYRIAFDKVCEYLDSPSLNLHRKTIRFYLHSFNRLFEIEEDYRRAKQRSKEMREAFGLK